MKKTIQIMPCLDIQGGRVVKGIHFVDLIDAGDPVACAQAYEKSGADVLGFLDITATIEKRRTVFDVLQQVTEAVHIPVVVGGGIQTLADVEAALAAGATKVSISTAAFRDRDFVAAAVNQFGGQTIILAIDADRNDRLPSRRDVFINGGRTATGVDAIEFAKQMGGVGVGEILPTSKVGDGAKHGYDLDLIRGIVDATQLPTVASGGAGKLVHFVEAVKEGHASTLLAASVFHFGTFTVQQVKAYLAGRGIAVRHPPVARMD
ncbi:MAG: HisA/HisF-related TIM barrel protein [Kiritimatiellae bacterium]|nr:HisA/HisF-related TIM barrel protein [Kiritimatiellia bacterium]